MIEQLTKDISELIENLEYYKEFIKNNINEKNELDFLSKTSSLNVHIQILKNKLKKNKLIK